MEITVATYTFYTMERLSYTEFELMNRALHLMQATHPDERAKLHELRSKFESVEEYNEAVTEARVDLENGQ